MDDVRVEINERTQRDTLRALREPECIVEAPEDTSPIIPGILDTLARAILNFAEFVGIPEEITLRPDWFDEAVEGTAGGHRKFINVAVLHGWVTIKRGE